MSGLRPEDTFEGRALIGEQEWLDSLPPRVAEMAAERARREKVFRQLIAALRPLAAAYPDDPGTSDLDDAQPVTVTLGDVRRAWAALAAAGER